MYLRRFVAFALASAAATGLFLAPWTFADAKGEPSPGLAAQIAAQGKLIKTLQAQVAALQHGAPAAKTTQAHTSSSGRPVRVPDVTHKLHLADLSGGLSSLATRHAQFLKYGGPPHPIFLPSMSPSALQQLTTQVTQLTQQVTTLQSELSFDENLLGEEIGFVQKNLTTLANAMPVMPPGQGFCGANGAMTWGNFKSYLDNNRADGDLICYLTPGTTSRN